MSKNKQKNRKDIFTAMANKILVETSARHVHVTAETLEILFGKGHTLTNKKDLSQPGQFACEERVKLVGPKKEIANVIILGPVRPATQVEVSYTDARTLGVDATAGVIVAKRHIHMTPDDAAKYGVENGEIVSVKIESGRSAVLGDVVVRVSPKFALAMHIDTDEANAACAFGKCYGELIK